MQCLSNIIEPEKVENVKQKVSNTYYGVYIRELKNDDIIFSISYKILPTDRSQRRVIIGKLSEGITEEICHIERQKRCLYNKIKDGIKEK